MKPIAESPTFSPKAKAMQSRLSELGFYKSAIDGQFGDNTENGLMTFQKAKGLEQNGIMDVNTWVELFGIKTF